MGGRTALRGHITGSGGRRVADGMREVPPAPVAPQFLRAAARLLGAMFLGVDNHCNPPWRA